jgi:hypothetical protein
MRTRFGVVAAVLVLAPLAARGEGKAEPAAKVPAVLNFKMKGLDG